MNRTSRVMSDREKALLEKAEDLKLVIDRLNMTRTPGVAYNDSDYERKRIPGFEVSANRPFNYLTHESADVYIPVIQVRDLDHSPSFTNRYLATIT